MDEKNCLGLVVREPSFFRDISRGPRDVVRWVFVLGSPETWRYKKLKIFLFCPWPNLHSLKLKKVLQIE